MGEKDHRAEIKAMDLHKPGCLVRCETRYVEGDPCSHRWQAAEQARAEPDVYPMELSKPWRIVNWGMDKLSALRKAGGLAGGIERDANDRTVAYLKPFHRSFIPFPHNAHHIIPMSNLWNDLIDAAAEEAAPESSEMRSLVVTHLLEEPYNINDRVNMVTLPTRHEETIITGLPQHVEGGKRDHPAYRRHVRKMLKAILPSYKSMATALKTAKHDENAEPPRIGPALESISKAVYSTMMSTARSKRNAGRTLDDVAEELASLAMSRLTR